MGGLYNHFIGAVSENPNNPFNIAERIVKEFIHKEVPFTWEELTKKISEEGGIGRIAPGFTVGQFLDEFIDNEIIYYDAYDHIYRFTSKIRAIIKEQMDAVVLDDE